MYLYCYLSTHGISGLAARGECQQLDVHLKMMIEWTRRYTPRPWSSECGDARRGRDRARLEMQLETEIEWTQRCTGRPWSSELWHAHGGHDRASVKMQLETEIEWTQRCTGRPWSSACRHALGGRDRVNSGMHSKLWSSEFRDALGAGNDPARLMENLEVVNLEAVDGRRARCCDSIHRLVIWKPWECDEVTSPLKLLCRTGWWQAIWREVRRKLHSGVNSKSREWRDDRPS